MESATCPDCYEVLTREIAATGHSYDEGVETTPATCTSTGVKTFTCEDCEDSYTETLPMLPHTNVNGRCFLCGQSENAATAVKKYYIATIRSSGNYFYMTSDLSTGSTKRYQAVDSGLTTLPENIANPETDKIFVLEPTGEGTYYIYAEGIEDDVKYLGYDKKNSGILVAKDDALELTIELKEGHYNIHYNDGSDERYLSLNNTSGNNYFAWYTGTQKQDLTLIPVGEQQSAETLYHGASVTVGTDLSLNFNVHPEMIPEESVESYSIRFTHGEKEVVISAADAKINEHGYYVFTLKGIAPQLMSDAIGIALLEDGELLAETATSIKAYAESLLALDDTGYDRIASDLLYYGAAAQLYIGYNTDNLATDGVEGLLAETTVLPTDEDDVREATASTSESFKFIAAGVRFDYTNKIYVKLNSADDTVTVKVNGEEVAIVEQDGAYYAYSTEISALAFDETYTFTLEVDGEEVQTLKYSVNTYAYYKANGDTNMAKLAAALYRYGLAAEELKSAN